MKIPFTRLGILLLAGMTVLEHFAGLQAADIKPGYQLTVTAQRDGAIYAQGEEVTFLIRLTKDGQPVEGTELLWNLSKDGVPPMKSGRIVLEKGQAVVSGSLDEPGFLQCRVTFRQGEGEKDVIAFGGAGIDPLKIKPSMPVPDDFDQFWKEQVDLLKDIPANAKLTPVKSSEKGIVVMDLQADAVGQPVSGYLAKPEGAQKGTLPAILTVHGAGVVSAHRNGATNWAKRGFLALDINAHGLPNGKPREFYKSLADGELKDYRTRGRDSRDTIYFKGMFVRLVRAIDVLTAQPEWDGRVLVVRGSSQGGAQAIAAAALDKRVTFFVAGVPAMCDITGPVVGRAGGWPRTVSARGGKLDPKVVEAARYYDMANFVTRIQVPGFFTVGFVDRTCAPTTVYAVYNNLNTAKSIYDDVHAGHTNTPAATQAMLKAITDHVASRKSVH